MQLGVIPKEVEILSDQEVVVEVEELPSIIEVSQGVQGLCHWGGQAIKIDGIVAVPDSIPGIVKEWEIQREKQKQLEQKQ